MAAAAVFLAVLTTALLHTMQDLPGGGLPVMRLDSVSSSLKVAVLQQSTFQPRRISPFTGPLSVMPTGIALPRKARHTPRPEALELYLQGRRLWRLRTAESLELARKKFLDAIGRDPEYAQAYAGLADCYLLSRQYGAMASSEAFPKAEAAAHMAVTLDDQSPEAHRSMAFVLSYWNWDMAAAEREFRRALALNPNDAEAHHWYATSLMHRGRFDEALHEINIALSLDPASIAIAANRGLILLLSGDHEAGAAVLRGVEASNPGFPMAHIYMADEDLRRGEDGAFLKEEETVARAREDSGLEDQMRAARRSLQRGGHAAMLRTLAEISAASADSGGDAYRAAFYEMQAKDRTAVLHYLRISHDRHEPTFLAIDADIGFSAMRGDPEFRALRALADVHA